MRVMEAFQEVEGDTGVSQGMRDLDLHQRPDWILFFDEDFLPLHGSNVRQWVKDSTPSLVLFEDFETGAINDATLLARVDSFCLSFFHFWHEFLHSMNSDPASLNLDEQPEYSAMENLLLHWLDEDLNYPERPLEHVNGSIHWVESRFKSIQNLQTYDRYVATAKYVLGPRRRFKHVWVLRRGHGLCMDITVPFDHSTLGDTSFLCFKTNVGIPRSEVDENCMVKVSTCQTWISRCMLRSGTGSQQIHNYRPQHMGLGMVNDIEHCWPECPHDVPGGVWEDMERGLLFNARCANHQCRLGCCCKDFDLLSEQHAAESADAFLVGLLGVLLLGFLCFALRRALSRRERRPIESVTIELTTFG